MFQNKYKVVGVLGGMGPRATADFYMNLINFNKVQVEQDHIATLIYSNPKIPDRTCGYNDGDDHLLIEYLINTAMTLESAGADFIVIPCNTAHIYYEHIKNSVKVPVINMIDETMAEVSERYDSGTAIALLATDGTYMSGIYQKAADDHNIKLKDIPYETKLELMEIVYNIKIGADILKSQNKLKKILDSFKCPVILGCTELPLIASTIETKAVMINPTEILASVSLELAKKE